MNGKINNNETNDREKFKEKKTSKRMRKTNNKE